MKFLYKIFILFYSIGIKIYSVFNKKAKQIVIGQKDILNKIYSETKESTDIVWFHAASLGEYEQGKSVILSYKKKNPSHKILLTFYSPSGYDAVKKNHIVDWIFYLPHDTKNNARFIACTVKPIKVVFIKYEFWFHYIQELYQQKIPIYFMSCKFRKNQYFFRFYGKWFAKQLRKVSHFFVQDMESEHLLKSIKIKNISISGDSRFDTVFSNSKTDFSDKRIESFIQKEKVIILGSVWKEDLKLFNDFNILPDYKIIIAPHEIDKISTYQQLSNSILLSKSDSKKISNYRILIIDKIGILSKAYRYADIAYIGGGFGKGIHNTLEAAIYNIPVVHGPNYYKFTEAKELLSLGLSHYIKNTEELISSVKYFENTEIKQKSREYIESKLGAARKITDCI